MLLKSADDKSKRLTLLEDLQKSQLLDFSQKKWLREELMRVKKGIQGEKDSAHYIDSYFKDGENHVVLHDLRFVVDGDVSQIDHLIINRGAGIYLIETKNYSGNLVINEHGEFTAEYDDLKFGIPSPIEQSHRHERVLVKLLDRLEIVGRTQKQPDFHHLVMLHPKARIERPDSKAFDTTNVIKSDQFPSWHKQFVNTFGVGAILKVVLNLRSLDTIREWGEKLKRQHRPADLMTLPEFMRPKQSEAPKPSAAVAVTSVETATAKQFKSINSDQPTPQSAKRLICAQCGVKISYPEGKFCWNNSQKFGGQQYCREHQAAFKA